MSTAILQYILPKFLLSRFAGYLARSTNPRLKTRLINYFLKNHPVDLTEAVQSNPKDYACFHDIFVRPLKPDVRPINPRQNTAVSPVDGTVSQCGSIRAGQLLQAKKHTYKLFDLLGGYSDFASEFEGGTFITTYLAPHDYHRVHMPLSGTLKEMIYIPGQLFSVQPATVKHIPNLFARNERVVCFFETTLGPMAVILVGAAIVGSIHTSWHGQVTPEKSREIRRICYPNPRTETIRLNKGEEVGFFTLGSTVITLLANQNFETNLTPGEGIKLGEVLASVTQ